MCELNRIIDKYSVTIRPYRLPGARGYAQKYGSGYLVLINDQISHAAQKKAAVHELLHIHLGHLDHRSELPEEEKEAEVREALKAMGY